jgi:hypothetical protein
MEIGWLNHSVMLHQENRLAIDIGNKDLFPMMSG